jgi:hypothetical protein
MSQRSWTENLKEKALAAFALALELGHDPEFRQRLSSALEHGRAAQRRARHGRGIAGAARRLAADQVMQTELQEARKELQQLYALVNAKKRSHRLRRITPLAALASLAAIPEVRERLSALIAAASKDRDHLHGLTRATSFGRDGGPPTLEGLTKEELYARAQEAEIPGRSEMSKDELVAALRSKH